MKKNVVIEYFDVLLHEIKAKKKEKKRKRQKQGSKRKQKRKTGRKKERKEEERDREREIEKGGRPKKAKEKQRETLKNKQKCPFLGGENSFLKKSKERIIIKKTTQKLNKEGLVPSEVAPRLTLKPSKTKKTKNKTTKK